MLQKEEKPIMVYQKNIEKTRNKLSIPKAFVETNGNKCYLEVYNGYLKIVPIKGE